MLTEILIKLSPIFLLMGLGIVLRTQGFLTETRVETLKQLILTISLPAILFGAFLRMEIRFDSMLMVVVIIFLLCLLLYGIGWLLQPIQKNMGTIYPFLFTGFEFGMMGTVFFGAAFGMDKMSYIALIALGHEIFIWFVYVTLLENRTERKRLWHEQLKKFFTSPIIIAILSGLILNLLGLRTFLEDYPLSRALFLSLDYLTQLTVPLILLIIGYGLRLHMIQISDTLLTVLLRFVIVLGFAVGIDILVFRTILELDPLYTAALYTFVLLPPPFIIPLFIRNDSEARQSYVNSFLLLYSLLSIGAFSVFAVLYTSSSII